MFSVVIFVLAVGMRILASAVNLNFQQRQSDLVPVTRTFLAEYRAAQRVEFLRKEVVIDVGIRERDEKWTRIAGRQIFEDRSDGLVPEESIWRAAVEAVEVQ